MKRRLLCLILAAVLVVPLFATFFSGTASAADITQNDIKNATGKWQDAGTIVVHVGTANLVFKDSSTTSCGNSVCEVYKVQNYDCDGKLTVSSDNKSGQLDLDFQSSGTASKATCQNVNNKSGSGGAVKIPLNNLQNADKLFAISADKSKILETDPKVTNLGDFSASTSFPGLFVRDSESGNTCQDVIVYDSASNSYKLYELTDSGSGAADTSKPAPPETHQAGCFLVNKNNQTYFGSNDGKSHPLVAATTNTGTAAGGSTSAPVTPSGGSGSGSSGSSNPDCESDGGPLAWITCKVIESMANVADSIYHHLIQPLLDTPPIEFTDSSGNPTQTFTVWSNFRVYGDIFLVIALLIIIFSEAIGGGLLDAYSVRKVLPRLLIAAIAINLSIYIVAFAVDITNILGNGLESLIETPFKAQINAPDAFTISVNPGVGNIGFLAILGGAIWAIASIDFVVVMMLLPAFLILLGIMATVIIRRGLILILLFLSPVAFALWCLPNTERYFKSWWDLMLKTLLVYPIIAVLFGMGNILSTTINSSVTGVGSSFAQLLSIAALFAPLALIPFSFRIAGGILGRIHDFATNASSKAHSGLVGSEQDPESMRSKAVRGAGMRRAKYNLDRRSISTLANPKIGVKQKVGRLAATRNANRLALGQQATEANRVWAMNQSNDQFLLAHADRGAAEKELKDAKKKAEDAKAINDIPEMQKQLGHAAAWQQALNSAALVPTTPATKMASLQKLATTGFQFDQGRDGYHQLVKRMADVTGATLDADYDSEGNVTAFRRATGVNAGAFADGMNQAQFGLRSAGRYDLGGINNGTRYDAKGGTDKASLYELANAKPESIQAMTSELSGTVGMEHAVAYKELESMLPNSKGAARDQILTEMENLRTAGVESYMNAPLGGVGPPKSVRVNYDPARHAAWDPMEKARGWRTETRGQTNADLAQSRARSYERPNPDQLGP